MLRLSAALLGDRRVSLWLKFGAAAGVVYVFSPLDVIPDFTGIGLLDDIVVTVLIVQTLIDLAPSHVVDEHCARLGFKREELDMDVPKLVGESIELIAAWWTSANIAREALSHKAPPAGDTVTATAAPSAAAGPASDGAFAGESSAKTEAARTRVEEPRPPAAPEIPPSARRYSAFREDQN